MSPVPTIYTDCKGYMKAVKTKLGETNPDRVDAFEKGAAAYAKKIVGNFKDYEFVRFSQPATMVISERRS
jgi:hypothetical protein